ncbi:MAG: pyridoxal phosphate-dependent aminotransferase [Eubacteriales bacterium]|nr:pyridoxal phosphate-dependent aminotransferase [Eubacteriales bacterium]
MNLFGHENIKLNILKERAYSTRWAEVEDGVIPLTAADSDFPVAPEIVQDLTDYIKDGYFSYTPKLGLDECRKSIANALKRRKNEDVDPELVLPIDSAARGMFIISEMVLEPGDEAIIFDPVDFLFKESILAAGGKPVLYSAKINQQGHISLDTIEDYITDKTKMICLCNPHNPLGKLYPMEDLDYLLQVAEKHDLWIMNDEIWSDIIYPGNKFNSILELGNNRNKKTISVFGFSKSFGIAGLRAGCIYCQDEAVFSRLVDKSHVMTTAGGITSLSQIAIMACMDKSYYWLDQLIGHLEKNRDYVVERIAKMPYISCEKPEATFLIYADIKETGMTSEAFVKYLHEQHKLLIAPGSIQFFGPGSAGHVRISFSTSHEILKEGMDRLENALKTLDGAGANEI